MGCLRPLDEPEPVLCHSDDSSGAVVHAKREHLQLRHVVLTKRLVRPPIRCIAECPSHIAHANAPVLPGLDAHCLHWDARKCRSLIRLARSTPWLDSRRHRNLLRRGREVGEHGVKPEG